MLWDGIDIAATKGTIPRLRRKYQKLRQDPGSVSARHRTICQHFVDLADVVDTATLKEKSGSTVGAYEAICTPLGTDGR